LSPAQPVRNHWKISNKLYSFSNRWNFQFLKRNYHIVIRLIHEPIHFFLNSLLSKNGNIVNFWNGYFLELDICFYTWFHFTSTKSFIVTPKDWLNLYRYFTVDLFDQLQSY